MYSIYQEFYKHEFDLFSFLLSKILLMGSFNIILINHCILHSCINLRMTKYFLYLLYWHPLIYCSRSHRTTKLMRMNLFDFNLFPQISEPYFHAADFQSNMRCIQCHQQCVIVIRSHLQILLQASLQSPESGVSSIFLCNCSPSCNYLIWILSWSF